MFEKRDPGLDLARQQLEAEQEAALMNVADNDATMIREQEVRADLIRWQQDLSAEVERAIHRLRREHVLDGKWTKRLVPIGYDKETKQVMYQEAPNMINEYGIDAFLSLIEPLLSKNLLMSNYSEARLCNKLKNAVINWILDLGHHHALYEIERGDLSSLVQIFKDLADPGHWRSYNNGERRFITTTHKSVEAKTERGEQPPQHKGFLGVLTNG